MCFLSKHLAWRALVSAQGTVTVETPNCCLLRVNASQTYRPWWGGARLRLLFILEGAGQLCAPNHYVSPMNVQAGQTWVLSAKLTTPLFIPGNGKLSFLEAAA